VRNGGFPHCPDYDAFALDLALQFDQGWEDFPASSLKPLSCRASKPKAFPDQK